MIYFNYGLYVFQFEQIFRHFRAPARAPETEPGPGAAYPLTPLIGLAYSRALRRIKGGFSKGGVKRSSGPISIIPGGDRVAVNVGVVQLEKVNDQMGQGRSV